MKILVFCTTSVSDVIFSTPLVRVLRTQIDDAEVHYMTQTDFVPILDENPYLSKIIAYGGGVHTFFRDERYDAVIDLSGSLSIRVAALLTRTSYMRHERLKSEKWLMSRLKINHLHGTHVADRMVGAAAALGVRPDDLGLDYFIPDSALVPTEWLPKEFRTGFVVFAISGAFQTRRLPVDRMIELCDRINKPVLLLGDAGHAGDAAAIEKFFMRVPEGEQFEEGLRALNKKTVIYNGVGKFSRHQHAHLVKRAVCVFTFDSEFVPIASAFHKQVFLVMGNTIPLFGRYPYRTKFLILENNKLECRPCSADGYKRCPRGHFNCMNKIVFDFYVP